MNVPSVFLLCGLLLISACHASGSTAPRPGTLLGDTHERPQHPMDTYLARPSEKSRTIIRVPTPDECPGQIIDESNGVLCLIEYRKDWRPFEFNGDMHFIVPLADG